MTSSTTSSSSSTTASPPSTSTSTPSTLNPLYQPPAPRPTSALLSAHSRSSLSSSSPALSSRLYIGNLHPTVSEYDLVQLFHPFGKIAKLDLLFHKAGPLKGKPRGYGFVEYTKEEDAVVAKVEVQGKDVKGRKLALSFAKKPEYADQASVTGPIRRSRGRDDVFKPTTLSLVKNSQQPQGTNAKIAAMEARLQAMKASKNKSIADGSHPPSNATLLKMPPPTAGLPNRPTSNS